MNDKKSTYNDYRIAVPNAFEDLFSHFYFAENNLKHRRFASIRFSHKY